MKKKLIPMFAAVVMIIVVVIVSLSTGLLEKYSYSSEKADLYEYFGLASEDEAAVMMDNQYTDLKARFVDNTYYLDYETVITLLNSNFYYDSNEKILLYTTPTETIRTGIDSLDLSAGYVAVKQIDETVYIALDYVKKYTNMEYTAFDSPRHMEIKNTWGNVKKADIKKKDEIRILGGVKSAILTEVSKGDTVVVLEQMEEWAKVKTSDGYIGYIENKRLDNIREEAETPVTDVAPMVYDRIQKEGKICLGWHQVTNVDANATLSDVVSQTKGMNVISPTWFSLSDNEGNFTSIASADYVAQAHDMGIEVWGLIDNFSTEIDSFEILSYTSKRERLISQIVQTATEYDLDGINIDFENLSTESGVHFAQFIRELSIPCGQNGIILSVDNYVPKAHSKHYYRDVQGKVADYVIIMGYDEHYDGGGESGSVASVDFVREGIENTLTEVPADKIINGIPFYTRIWTETPKTQEDLATESEDTAYNPVKVTSEAVGMKEAENFLAENGVTASWDEATAQNYAQVEKDGAVSKVWLEDEASIDVKMQLIQKNNLAGVACWKLGFEKPAVWDVITKYLN